MVRLLGQTQICAGIIRDGWYLKEIPAQRELRMEDWGFLKEGPLSLQTSFCYLALSRKWLSFLEKASVVSDLIMINLPGINACLTLDQLPRNHDTYKK